MTATRLAVVLGVVLLGALCFLAAIGFTPLVAPLVTVVLLVVLVGGGNLLSGSWPEPRPAAPRDRLRAVSLYRDTGVVLRTYRLGEADRIVVLFTAEHGKVRAVAKGVRRTGSKFGARLEPLSHVALLLWSGRGELDVVSQAEVVDHFRTVREDLDRLAKGLSLLEVTDQLSQEGHPDGRLGQMLVGALRTLADPAQDPFFVAPAFFLKALVLEGAGPVVEGCASCGDPAAEPVAFDMAEGGALCRRCRRGRPVSPEAFALLRQLTGGGLTPLLSAPPPPAGPELTELVTEAMEVHLDRRLRSVRSVAGI